MGHGIKYVKFVCENLVKVCLSQVTSETAPRVEEHQAELHDHILNVSSQRQQPQTIKIDLKRRN